MENTQANFSRLFPSNTAILIIVLFFIALAGSWYFYTQQTALEMPKQEIAITQTQPTPTPQASSEPTAVPIAKISQGTNGSTTLIVEPNPGTTYKKFSLTIPKNWIVGEDQPDARLTLSSGDYKIKISQVKTDGGLCVFPDTNGSEIPAGSQNVPEQKYTQLQFKQGKFRRVPLQNMQSDDSTQLYKVCENTEAVGGIYKLPAGAGAIQYSVPATASATLLQSMDRILATINYCDVIACPEVVSTTTDERMTGMITEADTSCFADGICKIKLNEMWVILETGGRMVMNPPQQSGILLSEDGITPTSIGDMSVGKMVEVFAGRVDSSTLTLAGKKEYYVKLLK